MKKKKLVASLLGAGLMLASGIVIGTTARAVDFSHTNSYVTVGDLWNKDDKTFNQDNLRILAKYISGDSMATKEDLETLSASGVKASTMRAKQISAGMEGDIGYTKKSSEQNINVWLGGLEWQVSYLSQDKNGDAILTLWLSNSTQEAFNGRSQYEGTHYGFYEGGLYSDWSNNFLSKSTVPYISAMYGTSYVRAVTLNNGGKYAVDSETLSENFAQREESAFALFTMEQFGLTDYIVTPAKVSWQEKQLTKTQYGYSNNCANDGWEKNQPDTGYNAANYNYSAKEGYDAWKDDYIWLPSLSEVGWDSSTDKGLWGLNVYQRMNYDGETITDASIKVGTNKGETYAYSILRTSHAYAADIVYNLASSGSTNDTAIVRNSYAIRPALHLNISDAMTSTTSRKISFETNGGSAVSGRTYYNGEKYLNLPNTTYEGKYFGGWYLDTEFSQEVNGLTNVSIGEDSAILYAKWEDNGYKINYNLAGGNSSVTLPTAIGVSAEFNLQEPTRFGHIFKGWKLGEGTNFSTAIVGTAGATTLATQGDCLRNASGGGVYFKNLAQAGETITIEAVWEVDSEAKEFQVLSYNEYFLDNNISKDTIKIHNISTAKELGEAERDLYMEYDLVICGDKYFHINTTEGFMYLMNYSVSGINLDNMMLELNCNVYINDETFDENGDAKNGDHTVYQFSPPTTGKGMCFDGNGHTIYGLYHNNPETTYFALFYCGGSEVQKIENLTVADFFIKIASNGSVIGYIVNKILNCDSVNGYLVCPGGHCSGVVYSPKGLVQNCINNINIFGGRQSSGVVYIATKSIVFENCSNYGNIAGTWAVAGIISRADTNLNLTFKNCDNYGDITGSAHTSGILGIWYGKCGEFIDCDNHGKIDGGQAAGFCGYVEGKFNFYNCTNDGWSSGAIFVNNIVSGNAKNTEQYFNFVNCSAVIRYGNPLVSGGTPTIKTKIKMKNIFVNIDCPWTYKKPILLEVKNSNIICEYENIHIKGRTTVFQGFIANKEGSFKNIIFDLSTTSYTTRTNYINNNTADFFAENIMIRLYNRNNNTEIKHYYGTDFSGFYSNWKSGEIGLKALSGKGFYQSTLTEQMLIEKGYTKKAV